MLESTPRNRSWMPTLAAVVIVLSASAAAFDFFKKPKETPAADYSASFAPEPPGPSPEIRPRHSNSDINPSDRDPLDIFIETNRTQIDALLNNSRDVIAAWHDILDNGPLPENSIVSCGYSGVTMIDFGDPNDSNYYPPQWSGIDYAHIPAINPDDPDSFYMYLHHPDGYSIFLTINSEADYDCDDDSAPFYVSISTMNRSDTRNSVPRSFMFVCAENIGRVKEEIGVDQVADGVQSLCKNRHTRIQEEEGLTF